VYEEGGVYILSFSSIFALNLIIIFDPSITLHNTAFHPFQLSVHSRVTKTTSHHEAFSTSPFPLRNRRVRILCTDINQYFEQR
jgi:hypothetical protein